MKKKLLTLILILVCMFGLVFAAGCDLFKPTDVGEFPTPEIPEIPPEEEDPLIPPPQIPEHNHKYGWVISRKPTESLEGQAAYCCNVCKKVQQYKYLPTIDGWTRSEIAATCESNGWYFYTVNRDGMQFSFSSTIPKLEHSYGEWTVTLYPKTDTPGSAKSVCSVCKSEKTLTLPEYTKWQKVNDTATCEAGGRATLTVTVEGAEFSVEAATSALGHKWSEWQIDVPTCTQKGQRYRVCENDNTHREVAEELPITHNLQQKHDEENHWIECGICGLVINKTEHTLVNFRCNGCTYVSKAANLIYELNSSGSYSVTGRLDDEIEDIIVPDSYNSVPVTQIAQNAFAGKTVGDIKLPSNFTVGRNAFSGAKINGTADLSKVTIEEGAFAFAEINEIILNSQTQIGDKAFFYATLTGILYEGSQTEWNAYIQVIASGNDAVKSPRSVAFTVSNQSGCKNHICTNTDRPEHDESGHWFICDNEDCYEIIFKEEHTYNAGGSCIICGARN